MPIYEYRCAQCGFEFERLQKISDDPITTCPECHEEHVQKKISAAGFRLKGSGWYETDFKGKKSKTENKKPDTKTTKPAGKDDK